jgi:hypothetical protein
MALLQRRQSLLVRRIRPRSRVHLPGTRGLPGVNGRGSAEEEKQRGAKSNQKHPRMNENEFHAKDSSRAI